MTERYSLRGNVFVGESILSDAIREFASQHRGRGVVIVGAASGANAPLAIDADRIDVRRVRSAPDLVATAASDALARASWAVAVGGAATIDIAKLLRIRSANSTNPFESCRSHADVSHIVNTAPRTIPLLCAPLVAGSGAEISTLSDVLRTSEDVRVPFISARLVPEAAVIDVDITSAAPAPVRAAAAFDAFTHLVDPWLGNGAAPAMQERTSERILQELVTLATGPALGGASFVRLSHLAITPGLARVGGHASCAHRIEHAFPTDTFPTHGAGLAYVITRMLRWAEDERKEAITSLSRALCTIFGRHARPSSLVADFANGLGLDPEPLLADDAAGEAAARGVRTFLEHSGFLPGGLAIGPAEVREILGSSPRRTVAGRLIDSHTPNPARVFGLADLPDVVRWIVTPIPAIAQAFGDDRPPPPAWFPTRLVATPSGTSLLVSCTPGADALVNCLDLLATLAEPPELWFLGLAAAVGGRLSVGEWTRAITPIDRLGPEDSHSAPPLIHSVARLSHEGEDLFECLRWQGVDLLDLESEAFARWAVANDRRPNIAVIVSDRPSDGPPIWAQPADSPPVIDLPTASRRLISELCSGAWSPTGAAVP